MKTTINDGVGIVALNKKMMGVPETDNLYNEVNSLLEKSINKIVLDLKDVAWMNSMGVGSVIRCYTSVVNSGGNMYLARLTEKTGHIFMITKLITIFKIFDNLDEAIDELKNLPD